MLPIVKMVKVPRGEFTIAQAVEIALASPENELNTYLVEIRDGIKFIKREYKNKTKKDISTKEIVDILEYRPKPYEILHTWYGCNLVTSGTDGLNKQLKAIFHAFSKKPEYKEFLKVDFRNLSICVLRGQTYNYDTYGRQLRQYIKELRNAVDIYIYKHEEHIAKRDNLFDNKIAIVPLINLCLELEIKKVEFENYIDEQNRLQDKQNRAHAEYFCPKGYRVYFDQKEHRYTYAPSNFFAAAKKFDVWNYLKNRTLSGKLRSEPATTEGTLYEFLGGPLIGYYIAKCVGLDRLDSGPKSSISFLVISIAVYKALDYFEPINANSKLVRPPLDWEYILTVGFGSSMFLLANGSLRYQNAITTSSFVLVGIPCVIGILSSVYTFENSR